MKKFLVPTDFSENARNALLSALELARVFKAEIILCTVYNQPSSGQAVLRDLSEQMKAGALEDLQNEIDDVSGDYPDIRISAKALKGDTSATIAKAAEMERADLIVLGKTGRSGLSNKIFGSVALKTIELAKKPLLLIPESWKYNPIDRLCLASDLSDAEYEKILRPMIAFAEAYKAMIDILHFTEDESDLDLLYENGSSAKAKIEKVLSDTPHHFVFGIRDNISKAIVQHIDTADFHMMCMVKHEYPWIQKVFRSSPTVEAVIRTKVPLLVLQ